MIEELDHWADFAACKRLDDPGQVVFFEDEEDNRFYPYEAEAKAYCEVCPVKADCLDWAIRTEERYGIYGGMTFMERRKVLRRRRKNEDLTDRMFDFMVKSYLVQNGFDI